MDMFAPVRKSQSEGRLNHRRSLFPVDRNQRSRSLSAEIVPIKQEEMDKGKNDALIAWVNALHVGPPVKTMKDFVDGKIMMKIMAACAGDMNTNNNNSRSSQSADETILSRMCSVEDFLQGFYQTHLTEKLDLEAVMESGDEFEVGKALMLLFGAAVQSSNRQHFVQLAMTLTNDQQLEVKDIIEPLLMKDGMNMPIIPDQYSTVLKTKMTISPSVARPPVARNLYSDSPLRVVRAEAFPDSPLTPIKTLLQSPQMACKLKLRDCEKKVRDLEAVVTEERHLRSELEWQLQDKQSSLVTAENRLQDQERRLADVQGIKDKLDEMEVLKMDKAKFEVENEKLRTKLSDLGQMKTNFQHLSKENEELLQTIFTLQDQLKDNIKLKETLSGSEQRMAAMEERFQSAERSIEDRNGSIKVLEENLREVQRELEFAREAHRENLLQTEERLGLSVMGSPVGESMSCFTQKRIDELQAEISSLIDQQEAMTNTLDRTQHDLETSRKQNESLKKEKDEFEQELEASNALVDDSETKLNNLTLQIGQLNAEMVEIKTAKSELQIKLYDEQESHEQDVMKLRKDLQRKEAEFDAEIQEYKDAIDGMKEEYKSKKLESEHCFEDKIRTLQDQQSQISELNSKLIDNMNSLSEKNQGFQRKLLDSDRKLNECKSEVKERQKTIEQLQKCVGDKSELMATLKDELEGVRMEMGNVQKLLVCSESEETRLKIAIQELESEKVTLNEEVCTMKGEIDSKFVQISTVEAELHNRNEDFDEERTRYQSRVDELEQSLEMKNDELCTLRETCSSLKSTIQEQEQSITFLEGNRDQLTEEKSELTKVIETREIELEAKTESIDDLVQSLKSERERVTSYTYQCEEFQNSLTSMEDVKMSMRNSIVELESKLSLREDEFVKLEEEKCELSLKLDGTGETIAKLEYEKIQIENEKESLVSLQQEEVSQWSEQMTQLNVEIDTLRCQHREELEVLVKNLSMAKEEAVKIEQRYQQEVEGLQQKLEDKDVKIAEVEKEVDNYQEELRNEAEIRKSMQEELEAKLETKANVMTSLQSQLSSSNVAHAQKLKEGEEHVARLEEIVQDGNENVASLETRLAESLEKEACVEAELREEKVKTSSIETTIRELEQRIIEMVSEAELEAITSETKLSEKISEIERLREDKMMLQNLSETQNEQLEEIHKRHAELESMHKLMHEDKTALEYVHSEMESNYYALEAANDRATKEIQQFKNLVVEKNAEFDKAREIMEENYMSKFDEITKAKSEVKRRFEESETKITSLRAKIDLIESDKEKLERKLNEMQEEDLDKMATLEIEISERVEMIASQSLELNETHSLLEHKTDKVRQLQNENEDLIQELTLRDDVISGLKTEVEKAEVVVTDYNDKIVGLEERCATLETNLNDRVVRMQKKMDEQIQEFMSMTHEKDTELFQLSSKLTENESQLTELMERCRTLVETNTIQVESISTLDSSQTILKRELQSRDSTISGHVMSLASMESRLEEVTSQKVVLEREFEESKRNNQFLSMELEDKTHKLTRLEDESETRISTLKSTLTETQSDFVGINSEKSELLCKLEQNGQQIAKMELVKIESESKIGKLSRQITTLEDSVQHLERKNMDYRTECLELQESLNVKIQDLEDYELRVGSDEDVINGLQSIISELQSDKSDLLAKVSAKDELISSLKSDVGRLQTTKSQSEQSLTAEKDRSRSLEARYQLVQSKLEQREAKLNELESKLRSERATNDDEFISELERKLDLETQLKSKFHHAFQKEENERKYLEAKVEKLKTKNEDLESEVRRMRADDWSKSMPQRDVITQQPTPSPETCRPLTRGSLNDSLESGVSQLSSPNRHEETLRNSAGKLTVQQLDLDREEFVSASRVFGSESLLGRLRHPSTSSSLYSSQQSIASDSSRIQQHMSTLFSCEDEPEEFQWNRLSELQRRNTLCLPHMKSSYPVETQVQPSQTGIADDLVMTSSRPNKYEQAIKTSTSGTSVQRHASGPDLHHDDHHQFIKPSSSYTSCHRTIPAEIKNSRLVQSHDFTLTRSKDQENNIISVATPSKGFKTPKSKKSKTPRSSSTSKKKSSKKLGMESSDTENDAYNRRDSVRFEIPFSEKKPKRMGLGFGRKKEKNESKSERKVRTERAEMPPPKESPKILRKPLNARNFLLFNNH